MLTRLLIALFIPSVSQAQQPAPAAAPPPAASPFKSQSLPAPGIEYPETGVAVTLVPADGQFVIAGSGLHALRQASLSFRSGGKTYGPGAGIRLVDNHVVEGANTVGRFIELSALWLVQNPAATHILTAVRLYEGLNGVVFEQSYPDGARSTGGLQFNDVGCAFPVFNAATDTPAGLRWLSYTYQDWPIPIRGAGWPNWLGGLKWPAPGWDDGIRAPLVLFNNAGRCETLSPLDHGLQQITALSSPDPLAQNPPPPAVKVGGEGRLQDLPVGASFHSVLLFGQAGVVATVMDWGRFLQRYNGKAAWKTPDDPTAHWLGYWTDNGSAYYSHGAGNANYQAVLAAVRAYHTENHIPVRYYQLDSWWYPKGVDGGTLTWNPNPFTIPNGEAGISRIVGAPLALHNRYWSSQSPYLSGGQFSTKVGSGVPLAESFYDNLFHTVTAWGCRLYEQDWLAFQYRKVDALQTQFGLSDQWMNAMDDAAAHWSLPIQFCMPSMGFYIASSGMPNVTQIRSSQDFGRDSWENVRKRWMEHGQLSLLATALGMVPSKDVFLTTRQGGLEPGDWEQTEALLAILSCGPVGIGDSFGFTDSGLVNRLCLEDGTLVQPDRPALPTEDSVTGDADAAGLPMTLQTVSAIGPLIWRYVMTLDLKPTPPVGYSFDPLPPPVIPTTKSLGLPFGEYVAYDYLHDRILGLSDGKDPVALTNGTTGQSYTVLAPMLGGGLAIIGDISRFVTASHNRISTIRLTNTNGDYYYEFEMNGPANSAVRLLVFDREGQPTLRINGEQVPSEIAKTRLALLHTVSPPPPGVSAGLGQTDGLWYFSFHLPAGGGPIRLQLRSATDNFPGPVVAAR